MAEILFWIVSCESCGLFVASDLQVDSDDNLVCPRCKGTGIAAEGISRGDMVGFSIESLLCIQRNVISMTEGKIHEMLRGK